MDNKTGANLQCCDLLEDKAIRIDEVDIKVSQLIQSLKLYKLNQSQKIFQLIHGLEVYKELHPYNILTKNKTKALSGVMFNLLAIKYGYSKNVLKLEVCPKCGSVIFASDITYDVPKIVDNTTTLGKVGITAGKIGGRLFGKVAAMLIGGMLNNDYLQDCTSKCIGKSISDFCDQQRDVWEVTSMTLKCSECGHIFNYRKSKKKGL